VAGLSCCCLVVKNMQKGNHTMGHAIREWVGLPIALAGLKTSSHCAKRFILLPAGSRPGDGGARVGQYCRQLAFITPAALQPAHLAHQCSSIGAAAAARGCAPADLEQGQGVAV
jgi:hypothetical protein